MRLFIQKTPQSIRALPKLPSSKSISNRLLMISALSGNKISAINLSESDDTRTMIRLLQSKDKIKDAGHAGTTMRFLTAFYSIGNEEVILTGTERMKNRPIGKLVEALVELGASIDYLEKKGYPPLRIRGKRLEGKQIKIDSGISSQYISALLMTAPYLKGGLEIILEGETLSYSYIELTLSLMQEAGARVEKKNNIIRVKESPYVEKTITAEADWSSASYWFMIAGMHPDAEIMLKGLQKKSYQGDSHITAMFDNLGVRSGFSEEGLKLTGSEVSLKEFRYDFRNNPDMVQSFIPYCIAKSIPFYFSGCRSLRIKETDRVKALYNELLKFGVEISFSNDGDLLWWDGKTKPDWNRKVRIETYKDHRMALGMAPLSIKTNQLIIEDPEVVSKSYPGFWNDIEKAGFVINKQP